MRSRDWDVVNQIFSNKKVKKAGTMDEVKWDKIADMDLEERRYALLAGYNPNETQEKTGQAPEENRRTAKEKG